MELKDLHKVHFVGIGGIGMSSIARFLNSLGITISGYDKVETELTKKLIDEGMNISYKIDKSRVSNKLDLVVNTAAINGDNPELIQANKIGVPIIKRAELLGLISKSYKTIAIAGTHGKTTCSTLVSHILNENNIPTLSFLGGVSVNLGTNSVVSDKPELNVVEADEFDRSFLHLNPDIAVITSTDADHLDIYQNHDQMIQAFNDFANKIRRGGVLIYKKGLPVKNDIVKSATYSIDEAAADYYASDIRIGNGYYEFDLVIPNREIKGLRLGIGGRHNVENAIAAIAAIDQATQKTIDFKKSLKSFLGIKRRFEVIYKDDSVTYIDDYAHHPTELNATIQSVKELYKNQTITGIFQPHLYSRTKDFYTEFAESLSELDELILLEIYPARELPIPGVSSKIIYDKVKCPKFLLKKNENILDYLKAKNGVILTLGAGDIDKEVSRIKRFLSEC